MKHKASLSIAASALALAAIFAAAVPASAATNRSGTQGCGLHQVITKSQSSALADQVHMTDQGQTLGYKTGVFQNTWGLTSTAWTISVSNNFVSASALCTTGPVVITN